VSYGNAQHQELKVQIRWLIRRDMPEVLGIERESFEFAWSEEDFLCCLRQRNCIGMVAEAAGGPSACLFDGENLADKSSAGGSEIVGFMIYELHKEKLRIVNFAVAERARRQGVGAQMIRRLIDKLSQQRRQEITLEIRETNLPAQLFFRHQGFRAVGVMRNYYEDTAEDAYAMQYRLKAVDDVFSPLSPRNRITEYGVSEYDAA
jgi:ribosomal-protein-alanine N-acetyltransferase